MSIHEQRRIRSYRREWARRLISRGNTPGNPPPRYGSAEWCALPGPPAKSLLWFWLPSPGRGNDVLAARDRVAKARGTCPETPKGCTDRCAGTGEHTTPSGDQSDDGGRPLCLPPRLPQNTPHPFPASPG